MAAAMEYANVPRMPKIGTGKGSDVDPRSTRSAPTHKLYREATRATASAKTESGLSSIPEDRSVVAWGEGSSSTSGYERSFLGSGRPCSRASRITVLTRGGQNGQDVSRMSVDMFLAWKLRRLVCGDIDKLF